MRAMMVHTMRRMALGMRCYGRGSAPFDSLIMSLLCLLFSSQESFSSICRTSFYNSDRYSILVHFLFSLPFLCLLKMFVASDLASICGLNHCDTLMLPLHHLLSSLSCQYLLSLTLIRSLQHQSRILLPFSH